MGTGRTATGAKSDRKKAEARAQRVKLHRKKILEKMMKNMAALF